MIEQNKTLLPLVEKNDEIDFRHLLGSLIDNRWFILSVTALFAIIGILYVMAATPVYQANAMVQVEQSGGGSILNDLSQVLPQGNSESATEIELIQSRMILGETVEQLNLDIQVSKNYFPYIGKLWESITGKDNSKISVTKLTVPSNLLGKPFILKIIDDNKYSLWQDDSLILNGTKGTVAEGNGLSLLVNDWSASPDTSFTVVKQSPLSATNELLSNLVVADKGQSTGVLGLVLNGTDPVLIKKTLDGICNNYLLQNVGRKSEEAAKSLDFLNKELPRIKTNLDDAENKLNDYRQQKDSVDLSLETKSMLDTLVSIDGQLNELTFKEADISKLYTKSHPTYRALLEQRKTLEDQRDSINKKINLLPKTQQEIIRLTRDVESGQVVYMQLLNKQQELSINKASTIGNVRIIDYAVTQPSPIAPRKMVIISIAIILGAMLAVAFVFIKAILNRGIEKTEQLEELGLNVYATVPLSEWQRKIDHQLHIKGRKNIDQSSLLAIANPTDLSVESIRNLRTSLHFAMLEAKNKILMITGASPGIGKSFIVTNLAAVISQSAMKVLLIDADMRRGYIHEVFGLDAEDGLSDILSKSRSIENCVKKTNVEGLEVITHGQIPPNPSELLMTNNFSELMSWAASSIYDIVLIDSPPVLAVTDATIIGNHAGTSLLVARFGQNTPKEIELSVKRLSQNGINVKGAILNAVVRTASTEYSYGYYHYTYDSKK
ncbi:tyrosine-protein kinase Etk/Wzc [Sodalis ligni]|uniref:Tyrosine-protein kinase Etk/Wzc n=2 Tax=Sodalis ligni TaxID=2697027 RepID=A0A4R1NI58_9GAMM|nr:polysaccharide biosynthesis tyrosine autokinase [Sodalis ligni]TCL07332.1 tyrosine-protein kinase Etk/Wzc [Sodalis ligni]